MGRGGFFSLSNYYRGATLNMFNVISEAFLCVSKDRQEK